jgi:hypothetical protein
LSTTEFELEGRTFTVESLGLDETFVGLEVFGRVAGPAISAYLLRDESKPEESAADLGKLLGALIQAALLNASQIPKLLRLFVKDARFDRSRDGKMVKLEPFLDEVFGGRVELVVAFLAPCVRAEYGSFLDGDGLASLLSQAGFSSPSAPTG